MRGHRTTKRMKSHMQTRPIESLNRGKTTVSTAYISVEGVAESTLRVG